jgi:MFS family permease
VPVFIIIFAIGNVLGPLTLGRLFDTIGRKPTISATYLGSAALAVVLGIMFVSHALTAGSFIAIIVVVFFLASAGASAALSDRVGDLSDGDPRARDRVLLCDRHRRSAEPPARCC